MWKKKLKKINKDYIQKGMNTVKDIDFKKVIDKAQDIYRKVEHSEELKDFKEDVKLFILMVKDYVKGEYKDVPYKTIAGAAFAVLYILNPIDLIPDFIPGVGYLDDAGVFALVLKFIKDDLENYKAWKMKQEPDQFRLKIENE